MFLLLIMTHAATDEIVEFSSDGDGGNHQEMRMGTYFKLDKMVKGFPVYEQTVIKDKIRQFLFMGPLGNWRVGPDTSTFTGSGLKNTQKSATPPETGWQYQHQGKWVHDNTMRATLKSKGKVKSSLYYKPNSIYQ